MQKVFSAVAPAFGFVARDGRGNHSPVCTYTVCTWSSEVYFTGSGTVIHKRAAAEETAAGERSRRRSRREDMYGGDDDERIGRSKKSGDREHGAR